MAHVSSAVPVSGPFDRARLRHGLRLACLGLAPLAAILVPLTTTGGSIACLALVVCWFLGGIRERGLDEFVRHPVGLASLALFGWMATSVLWSGEPTGDSLRVLLKYRPLLFLPVLLSLFEDERLRRWTTDAFLAAMVLVLVVSVPARLGWAVPTRWAAWQSGAVFKSHLVQNTLMAFAAFLLARSAIDGARWRWWRGGLAVLAAIDVLCIVEGRTGYVLLGVLGLFLCGTAFGRRGFVAGLLGGAVFGGVLLTTVPTFRDRVGLAVDQFAAHLNGATVGERNSIGLRLQFWTNGLAVGAERPLFGHGVGSFGAAYAEAAERRGIVPTGNPHNEYVMAFVQTGVIGTLLLVGLLVAQWRYAGRLPADRRTLARGLVVWIAVGSLFNSMLLDNTESHVFALFAAIALAGRPTLGHAFEKG